MPILDAALAFALTMLVVATVVTQLVRLITTLANKRSATLKLMLANYFTEECHEVVERELNRIKKSNLSAHTAITGATLPPGGAGVAWSSPEAAAAARKYVNDKVAGNEVDIPTSKLIELLKRSDMGKVLLQNLGNEAQAVFDELGKSYESVGDKFTEFYRSYSRRWQRE
jgi:hypothetical protein